MMGSVTVLVSVRYSALKKPVGLRGQISALRELEKWIFKILLETAQAIAFIMLLVSVAYSASLRRVPCIANFALCASVEKLIFQELL